MRNFKSKKRNNIENVLFRLWLRVHAFSTIYSDSVCIQHTDTQTHTRTDKCLCLAVRDNLITHRRCFLKRQVKFTYFYSLKNYRNETKRMPKNEEHSTTSKQTNDNVETIALTPIHFNVDKLKTKTWSSSACRPRKKMMASTSIYPISFTLGPDDLFVS